MKSQKEQENENGFKIKRIGFRVISNNELTGEKLDKSTTKLTQDLTIKFVDKILKI